MIADFSRSLRRPWWLEFIESGSEVPTSLADIHFAAFAGDPVDTCLSLGVLLVFV